MTFSNYVMELEKVILEQHHEYFFDLEKLYKSFNWVIPPEVEGVINDFDMGFSLNDFFERLEED